MLSLLAQGYGDYKAAKATAKAGKETAKRNKGIATDTGIKQEALTKPFLDTGMTAMSDIQSYVKDPTNFQTNAYQGPTQFDPTTVDVTQDPGYKFRLQQGIDTLDNSAAQAGALHSGKQQKELMQYGQDLASQEYAAAYKRGEDTFGNNFQRGFNVNQDTNLQDANNRTALLNAQGNLMNTGYGAMNTASTNLGNLASAQMGASNQLGMANAASAAAPWQALSNMGGTLTQAAFKMAPAMIGAGG